MLTPARSLSAASARPPRRAASPGNQSEFARAVTWVSDNLSFDIDSVVSVFETNIRVMGAPQP